MTFDCNGVWKSFLRPDPHNPPTTDPNPNDGLIDIDPEDENGNFGGTHRKSGQRLFDGKCTRNTITFKRRDGRTTYTYSGTISFEVIDGRRTAVVRRGVCRSTTTDRHEKDGVTTDDPWDGVKTT